MGFNLLYPKGSDVFTHAGRLAGYLQGFATGVNIPKLRIDLEALYRVSAELVHPDFPHVDGVEGASPFKKAAYFFVWFVTHKPILDPLPESFVGPDLFPLPNQQNVIVAYRFATRCLKGATLERRDGTDVILTNRIRVSVHSMCDMIDTFSACMPHQHYKLACLLFEQLAYKANPNAPYPEVL